MSDDNENPFKDLDEIDDEMSDLMFHLSQGQQGGQEQTDPVELIGEWLPGDDEYQAKTRIHPKQARALALVRTMPEIYPELEAPEKLASLVEDYEMYLTSIEGKSRSEQVKVLQALAGGEQKEAAGRALGGFLMQGLDTGDDE